MEENRKQEIVEQIKSLLDELVADSEGPSEPPAPEPSTMEQARSIGKPAFPGAFDNRRPF